MTKKWEAIMTATLVACAVLTTGVVLRREFISPSRSVNPAVEKKPAFVPDWQGLTVQGERMGPEGASVQIIEFADFECPFCADFHETLKRLRKRYPAQVSLTYVHFPIEGHRFAGPAARVAECAADQGRFEAMHDRLFEGQESLGLKSWEEYAVAAGVPDLPAFNVCIRNTDPVPRVSAGKALGTKLKVQGTPTVIINGWQLGHPPTEEELDSMVEAVLAGRSPVPGRS